MYNDSTCIHECQGFFEEVTRVATKAHLEGNKRYLEKQDNITIRVPKGEKAKIKRWAETKGKSLNKYIVDLINGDMTGV